MATVTFYEKPGCINNTRQKKLLTYRVGKKALPLCPIGTPYDSRPLVQIGCSHE
jgi:hypothetical protein